MSRVCELTGKGPLVGNNVSHAKNRTKRRYLPNLQRVTLMSESLGRTYRMRISASALRTIDHRGGFDAYLEKTPDSRLSDRARRIKRELASRKAETASADPGEGINLS